MGKYPDEMLDLFGTDKVQIFFHRNPVAASVEVEAIPRGPWLFLCMISIQ
jgi:hypothetical protein